MRIGVLVLAMTATATAQGGGESAKLFEEGRALAKDGKWSEACDKFAKSLELDHASGTLVNYADCQEHLNRYAQAYRLFDEAALASDKEGNVERQKFARQRGQALLLKVGTVIVKVATPGAPGLTLTIAQRITKPAAEIRDIVDPGEVTVEASAPGASKFVKSDRVEAGKTIVIEVPALGATGGGETTTTERRHSRVVIAYTLGGIGVVSGGAGIGLGFVARQKYYAEFDNGHCDQTTHRCNADGYMQQSNAITLANVGTAFGIVGAVTVVAAAVVFFTAPRDVVVTPTVSPESTGLAVVGRF